MIYSDSRNLLFVHVSRTGGVSLSNALLTQVPDATSLLGQHSSIIEGRNIFKGKFDQIFKFAFIRNPWSRMQSWYSLLVMRKFGCSLSQKELADPGSLHWKGFDGFLDSWVSEEVKIDGRTRKKLSQWGQLTDRNDNLLVDKIGRFENLEEEVALIFGRLGLKEKMPKINATHHLHYSEYFTSYGKELIEYAFPEDVTEFEYNFESVGH